MPGSTSSARVRTSTHALRTVRMLLMCAIVGRLLAPLPAQTQKLPPLPDLALDSFPAAARDDISEAARAADERPQDADAIGALGRILQAWEQWDAAHQAYARAHALAPKTFEWAYLDAIVLQRLAKHQEAAARLTNALSVNPDHLPARVRLAEALLDAGQLQESRPLFDRLVREPAAEPAAHVGLGRIAAAERRHEDAVRHFERAVTLFPELGAAHYALARSYRTLGRPADAERALAEHAKYGARWPRIEDPILAGISKERADARAHLQRGVALAEAGDLDAAIAAHEAAVERDPAFVQAHANLISLHGQTQNWSKAEAHYQKVIALGAELADSHYDYGVVLASQERWDEAEHVYRKALSVNPLHAPARNNLGQTLERRRSYEDAAAEYRRALEIQPTFRLARFNLGRMLLALGKPQDAVRELEPLQQPRDAESPRYLFGLATAYVQTGRKEDGIRLAAEARLLALEHGQTDLAAAIERELEKLR